MTKQLRITLVGVGLGHLTADVTLHRHASTWSASTRVEHGTEITQHTTTPHDSERDALVAIAEWLRRRFGASATCLASTVTIVGVSAAAA